MDAELLVERTFREVRLPLGVERVGFRPDFNVPPDFGFFGIHQLQPNEFPLRRSFSGVRRKRPSSPANGMVVVDPAPDDRVELPYQAFLTDGFVRIYDAPDFLQERVRVLLRRFHQWVCRRICGGVVRGSRIPR